MKRLFFLLILNLHHGAFTDPLKDRPIDQKALFQLTSTLGILPDKDIVQETQTHWLRKPGTERWEVHELPPEKRLFVLNWAQEQGLFEPWEPSCKVYDKAMLLGATTIRMQLRLNHLIELWKQGIRFDEIVWLTGNRPLDPRIDSLTDRCKTESEAALILWEETEMPEEMRNLPISFAATPMKQEGASLARPVTENIIQTWLKTSPVPCRLLFVSNQPFCGQQFSAIKGTLPKEFSFDCVGSGVDLLHSQISAAVILDAIARQIYQEKLNRIIH